MRTRDSVGRNGRIVILAACAFALLAPASAMASTGAVSDPLEPMNRAFFGFHQMLDHILIRPAAVAYKRILPRPIRNGITHVFSNLGEPAVFVNDVLQGRGQQATETFTRFAGNTTFGVLGIFDVATHAGLPHHPNDFGMTLARYGFKPGPYIFVPLAGPTTVRDAIGSVAGLVLNPLVIMRYSGDGAVGATGVVGDGLQTRIDADDQLKALFASATDPYASFRSYFLQNRQAEVNNGRIDIEELPDFGTPDTGASAASSEPAAPSTPASVPASTASASMTLAAPAPVAASANASMSTASASTLAAPSTPAMAAVATSVVGSAPLSQP